MREGAEGRRDGGREAWREGVRMNNWGLRSIDSL